MTPFPPKEDCMETGWHSKQKHSFIEAYLRIWPEHVGGKEKSLSLEIVDLNAGYGYCHDGVINKTWEGTAVLAARTLREYKTKHSKMLHLNSFHPGGGDALDHQMACLLKAVEAERPKGNADFGIEVHSDTSDKAVETILKRVNRKYPSIWLLDPYKPEELPWSVVEKVLEHSHTWTDQKGKTRVRRPELFISLMTHAVQRNVEKYPEVMSETIGLPLEEWWPKWEALRAAGLNMRDAALELYLDRLREYYEKEPVTLEIPSSHGNIVYVLIFCTDSNAGYWMFHKEGLPAFNVWRDKKWIPGAATAKATQKEIRESEKAGLKPTRLDMFGDNH